MNARYNPNEYVDDDDYQPEDLDSTTVLPNTQRSQLYRQGGPGRPMSYEESNYQDGPSRSYPQGNFPPTQPHYRQSNYEGRPAPTHYDQGYRSAPRAAQPQAPSTLNYLLIGFAGLAIGLLLMWGFNRFSTETPTAQATIDPSTATPEQIADLNNQIQILHTNVDQKDKQIAVLQKQVAQANTSSATTNEDVQKKVADITAKEASIAERETALTVKEAAIVAREAAVTAKEAAVDKAIKKLESLSASDAPAPVGTQAPAEDSPNKIDEALDSIKGLFNNDN